VNAADWGAGPAKAPPPTRPRQPLAPQRVPIQAISVSVTAWPPGLPLLPRTAIEYPLNVRPPALLATTSGPPVAPEALCPRRPLCTDWHVRDAVFEEWRQAVVNLVAWELVPRECE